MTRRKSLREELEDLRSEIDSLRSVTKKTDAVDDNPAAPAGNIFDRQMAELNQMVQDMLDEAELTVAEHPKATIAGALALGIVIGRLTAN